MVTVSFSYEFEFYYLVKDGNNNIREILRYHGSPYPNAIISSWDYQNDHTAGTELRTPIFTNIQQAIRSINREFKHWIRENTIDDYQYIPYFVNKQGISLGQHHHYGIVDNRHNRITPLHLSYREKYAIAYYVSRFYPFLASFYTNPLPSCRGLNPHYAYPLYNYGGTPIHHDHYAEISDSHHGTVELRLFDANIPQLAITITPLVLALEKKILENEEIINNVRNRTINRELYRIERKKALRYGLERLNIRNYLRLYLRHIGDLELPNVKSIKEILYLGIKHKLNVYQIYKKLIQNNSINKFDYFKIMCSNVQKYIENLDNIVNDGYPNSLSRIIEDTRDNAYNINRLSQYLEILEPERVVSVRDVLPRGNYPLRTYVRKLVNSWSGLSHINMSRIYEIEGYDSQQIAQIISDLINNYGGNFVNRVTSDYIINANERYYLVWFRHPIDDSLVPIGCIAIRIRTGEISSFVIHPRFRGLGLGKLILKCMITLAIDNNLHSVHLWVRKNNKIMQNLVESLGFTRVGNNDRSYKYILKLNQGG